MSRNVVLLVVLMAAFRLDASQITIPISNFGGSATLCLTATDCTSLTSPFSNQYGYALGSTTTSGSVGPNGIFLFTDIYANSGSFVGNFGFPSLNVVSDGGTGDVLLNDQATIFGVPQGFLDVTVMARAIALDSGAVGEAQFLVNGVGLTVFTGNSNQLTLHIPFQSGQPISFSGLVFGSAFDFEPNNPFFGSTEITATVGTSTFTVFDATGQRVTDFSYSTQSGYPLPFADGQITPEPSTFLFLGIGLGALVLLRRRATAP